MQIVKFPDDYYDEGSVKYARGSYHPLTSETQSLVNNGFAEMINTDNVDDVEALEAVAILARERADACKSWAADLDKEATAAEALAESARKAADKKAKASAKAAKAAEAEPVADVVEQPAEQGAEQAAEQPTEQPTADA